MKRKRKLILGRNGKPLKSDHKLQEKPPILAVVHLEIYKAHRVASCKYHPDKEARHYLRKIHDVHGVISSEYICEDCRGRFLEELMNAKDQEVESLIPSGTSDSAVVHSRKGRHRKHLPKTLAT